MNTGFLALFAAGFHAGIGLASLRERRWIFAVFNGAFLVANAIIAGALLS